MVFKEKLLALNCLILHFPGGDLSEIEAKIGSKNPNFMKKNGPKCLTKFYKMRISIKLDGFSKIIEKFVEKRKLFIRLRLKIDESASKIINRYNFSNKRMCFFE